MVKIFQLPESAGGVRSIYPQRPGRNDGNLYVGTTRNNIMEGSLQRRFNQVRMMNHEHVDLFLYQLKNTMLGANFNLWHIE